MICKTCGAKLFEGDLFCSNCGAKIETETAACQPDGVTVDLSKEAKQCDKLLLTALILCLCIMFIPYIGMIFTIPFWILTAVGLIKVSNVLTSTGVDKYLTLASGVKKLWWGLGLEVIVTLAAAAVVLPYIIKVFMDLSVTNNLEAALASFDPANTEFELILGCGLGSGLLLCAIRIWFLVYWIKCKKAMESLQKTAS